MRKLLVFLLAFSSGAASADTTSFSCDFDKVASQSGVKPGTMHFDFVVDDDSGKAYVLGNNGSASVEVVKSENGITFIEKTFAGSVQVTAYHFPSGKAVHSRNTFLTSGLMPTQYYGKCVVK